ARRRRVTTEFSQQQASSLSCSMTTCLLCPSSSKHILPNTKRARLSCSATSQIHCARHHHCFIVFTLMYSQTAAVRFAAERFRAACTCVLEMCPSGEATTWQSEASISRSRARKIASSAFVSKRPVHVLRLPSAREHST